MKKMIGVKGRTRRMSGKVKVLSALVYEMVDVFGEMILIIDYMMKEIVLRALKI